MNQLDNMLHRLFGKHSRSSAAMFVGLLCSVVLQIVESSRPVWTGLLVVALSVILFYVQIWLDKRKTNPKIRKTSHLSVMKYRLFQSYFGLCFLFGIILVVFYCLLGRVCLE